MVILLLIFFIPSAFAIEGTITVLEAPIFGEPDEKSPVIQYYRKGDMIYLHPQEAAEDPYKDENFRYTKYIEPQKFDDPLLNKAYKPNEESRFYKTLARSGREAYVLKEHVFVQFKDAREIGQDVIAFDHTDYRIEEPLPTDYPFLLEDFYRGELKLALGQPNYDPYPFNERVVDQSFNIATEISFVWSKAQELDRKERFFFGAIGGFSVASMDILTPNQSASQRNFRLFLGPHAAYDVYRDEKTIFNLYMNTQFFLLDRMDVSITDNTTNENEERTYTSDWGLSPNIGMSYQWLKIVGDLDLTIGANMRGILPRDYRAIDTGNISNVWRSRGTDDEYYQSFITELTYFIGFQNSY